MEKLSDINIYREREILNSRTQ